eukprot:1408563-Rhodomonas_salina.1
MELGVYLAQTVIAWGVPAAVSDPLVGPLQAQTQAETGCEARGQDTDRDPWTGGGLPGDQDHLLGEQGPQGRPTRGTIAGSRLSVLRSVRPRGAGTIAPLTLAAA